MNLIENPPVAPEERRRMDGRRVANEILGELEHRVAALIARGITPTLGILLIGDDPRSATYVRAKQRAAERIGIRALLERPTDSSPETVVSQIENWNHDQGVHGIIVQLPLPPELAEHELDLIEAVDPAKDVDGLHPLNLGRLLRGKPLVVPATPRGVMKLLDEYAVQLDGARVTLVGFGKLVGRALSALLVERGATLTIATSRTTDLASVTRTADVVISAAGQSHFITPEMVRDNVVLVDVGLSELDPPPLTEGELREGKRSVVGDIAPETRERASLVTPVPGGVGPMTVAMLLTNVVESAERLNHRIQG